MTNYLSAISQNKAAIFASSVTALATVFISLATFVVWFQETKMKNYISSIEENRINIIAHDERIEALLKDIDISTGNLEIEIRRYIDHNYGELSKRDENVAKLVFLYNQQDKRLSSIESVLTKY
ncbi:hypothetical protein DSLASN_05650 [Desulfoluna limicola]|uniref:Uncharacterized protein n=1 Tax=Desulfoluna limicola TaxID=2810562 RepID=A0ABN6EZL1_9BACT|nr:hypothetical protein [Desulfoluna limicola]BCS94933.1 hypothetical protein DSLASN_05650 [Desulfoluna limicola]